MKGWLQLNLNSEDSKRLDSTYDNGWLSDKIIDAAHALLRQEFPTIGGMQSCLLASGPTFRPEVMPFVQIVNTHPTGRGNHWILLSTINCPPLTIDVYDSMNSEWLSTDSERSIAKLMRIPLTERFITVRFPKSPNQQNASDCGVYAIANMVAILNGTNPTSIKKFDATSNEMRNLLKDYFISGKISPFPAIVYDGDWRPRYTHVYQIEIFCSCRMPDLGYYFTCDMCSEWFHPRCQNINVSQEVLDDDNTEAYCLLCHKGPGPQVVVGQKSEKRKGKKKK